MPPSRRRSSHDERGAVGERRDRRAERQTPKSHRPDQRDARHDVDGDRAAADHDRDAAVVRAHRTPATRCAPLSSRRGRSRRSAAAAAVAAVSAGRNRPRSNSSCTIGVARTIRPSVAGTFSISIMPSPRDTVSRIAGRCRRPPHGATTAGSTAVRDRHAEQADRQVHQAERIRQPRHGAGPLARREQRVDEEIDLRRRQPDRARPHQEQHPAQAGIAQIEHAADSGSLRAGAAATGSRSVRGRRAARRSRSP